VKSLQERVAAEVEGTAGFYRRPQKQQQQQLRFARRGARPEGGAKNSQAADVKEIYLSNTTNSSESVKQIFISVSSLICRCTQTPYVCKKSLMWSSNRLAYQ
jgi:hypothetical protein